MLKVGTRCFFVAGALNASSAASGTSGSSDLMAAFVIPLPP